MALDNEVAICNAALLRTGVSKRIESLSDDTVEAEACSSEYDGVRDAVLRDHPWRFAKKYATISADADTPAWYWTVQYTLPNDCLLLLGLESEDYAYEVVANRKLMTNVAAPLNIRYTSRVSDVTLMDPMFKQALVLKLASVLCLTLTSDRERVIQLEQLYAKAVEDARFADSSEQSYQPLDSGVVLRMRAIGPEAVDLTGDLQ